MSDLRYPDTAPSARLSLQKQHDNGDNHDLDFLENRPDSDATTNQRRDEENSFILYR
jgi:hypothetical protein